MDKEEREERLKDHPWLQRKRKTQYSIAHDNTKSNPQARGLYLNAIEKAHPGVIGQRYDLTKVEANELAGKLAPKVATSRVGQRQAIEGAKKTARPTISKVKKFRKGAADSVYRSLYDAFKDEDEKGWW